MECHEFECLKFVSQGFLNDKFQYSLTDSENALKPDLK